MTFIRTAVLVTAICTAAPLAWAQDAKMSPQDFVNNAASSDMFEIQSSKLALQNGTSKNVKDFANMMIKDHTKSSEDLKAAAQKDGAALPAEMSEKHATLIKTLQGATGQGFDAAYTDAQMNGHQEALSLMQSYAQNGEGALKTHAEKAIPVIQMHLEHAKVLGQSK